MKKTMAVWALMLVFGAPLHATLLFNTNATWNYFKGRTEASSPDTTAWRQINFNDASWTPAPAPFWYGDRYTGGTEITDMYNQYLCIFMRRTFVLTNLGDITGLQLGSRCDDGYIAWINGVEVQRYNMPAGNIAYNGTASGTVAEPIPFNTYDLTNVSMLVLGTNVMAVQAFNANLTSSDLGIDVSLGTPAPDYVPPGIVWISPAPGTVTNLSRITVTFSEPVTGVNAADLLINGVPAASRTGGNDTYTFTFNQPAYGAVQISWATAHGIADCGIPPNAFDAAAPGATWQYNLVDATPPVVTLQLPYPNVTVRSLSQIEVQFSENVTGVDAADLLINGNPAASLTVLSTADYVFRFTPPAPGTVQVQWAAGHGIRDLAAAPNAFAGGNWIYILDPDAVISDVRINELVAANINGLRDEDNEPQDWVELYNSSSNLVSLAGWSLTDDESDPIKWVFPAVTIGPRGYLVVFCSGKDRKPTAPGSKLHTNFKLDPDGEFLGLFNAEVPRQLVSSFNPFPVQRRDYSYGYDPLNQLRYFATPTPGAGNGASAITGVVGDTKFSHDRGFYTNGFSLVITCATPGVTIRYTLNGTAPSTTSGTIYSGPILITNTTVVRAFAYSAAAGLLPSDVDCHTYLFLDDVIRQSPTGQAPPGWPSSWGANTVNYGMDPEIVTNAAYKDTIKDDLKAIPTFSIVMNLDDLFNPSTGIYANPGGDGIQWERPCSLELVYPDDTEGFQINCGIRIRGGYSRDPNNPKHAFRMFFRQEYGAPKLNYPVFGPTGASSFDKFDIRTMQNYSWSFGGDASMICIRDVFSRDAQLAMGQPSSRGAFYHLYINGQYWGLFNTDERPEAAFAASYLGGRDDDYDVIKVQDGYTTYATDGNMDAWTRLWQAAADGFASDADYFKVQGLNVDGTPNPDYENLVDVDNLIDYMLVILYGGNLDAPISNFLQNNSPNNWYGFRDRTGGHGGFRFVSHDAEHTLLNVNEDRTGMANGVILYAAGDPVQQGPATALSKSNPQYIWFRLQANAEFRMRVADHVQRQCFNGGPLSVEGAKAIFLARSNEVQRAIVGESARWGDSKVASPFTRVTWLGAVANVWNSVIAGRTAVLLNQLRADNLFPSLNAPLFSSPGGIVPDGFSLFMTNTGGSGTIYYTLDGSDPRQRGGTIAPTALAYTPGTPIIINFPAVVRARVRSVTTTVTWSAITEALFYTAQDFSHLLVTEIMYHPPDWGGFLSEDLEFLELKNAGTNILDLSGQAFTEGINFAFTNGTRLTPGEFLVLGRNRAVLAAKYPGLAVQGLYTGKLDNGGERLTLAHALGTRALSVDYKDSGRWPITPDGCGFSLVPRSPNANPNPDNPSNWRASANPGGSPGADDPEPSIPGVVVNEAITHTDPPLLDTIELYNPTGASVDLGGWFLTDDPGVPTKFRIPTNTVIAAGGYLVFTETDFNPTPGTNNSFALDSHSDQVYLLSGDANANLTGYSHGFNFGAAPNGVSFGRYVISTGDERFVLQTARTPGATNAGPLVGPVVFYHIMYHPPDLPGGIDNQDDEYLELRNITTSPVPLFDPAAPTNAWRLRGGVDFDFPANFTLGPTQSLVLVSFDPTNTVMLAAFRGKYGTFGGARICGPYTGRLNNSSDNLELQRPDVPEPDNVPYIVVDKVDYKDSAPWPSSPDGSGAVLERRDLSAFGDDPANWVGAAPLMINSLTPLSVSVRAGTSAATYTNVTFTVAACGTGELTYQWRHDGVDIPDATGPSLTITNVQLPDQGIYTVLVTDLFGSVLSPGAELNVLVNLAIVQPPLSQTVVAGGQVTLSAMVVGSPPPFTFEWKRVSTPLYTNVTSSTVSFYTFTAPSVASTQNYRLVVKNPATPYGISHNPLAAVVVLADSDHDGLPDVWENAHNLNPTNALDAAEDTDGDTMSNWEEYIAGTDPLDPQSYLKVDHFSAHSPATLRFQAVSNRTYSVFFKDELAAPAWEKLADIIARPTNRVETVIDAHPGTNRFYRIATPQAP